ncbi:MAG: tRNA (adenosine(37)-N6)-threonylcarbamoyltransferase complex transferase subunit TsaD [Clostridia bacterium]|nr:tRNA (adenosine(37)-N6)-threonylcarbamoyltransferase complex transferase subunit TsaD [Clostridia bacterium]
MYKQKMIEKVRELKNKKDILILAIESSCDETSIAVVKNGREVLSNVISSQIEIHKRFGGVVPEVASRNHTMAIVNVLDESLQVAGVTLKDIDAVAVTYGAGLIGALMVGVNFAKGLAYANNLPLIAVNHIKGHIAASYLAFKELKPPFICLVVSGGHTAILKVTDYTKHTLIGSTLDDAVGEAYDKVSRMLGLGYPGGPKIDKLAKEGEANIQFTSRDKLAKTFNSSYSGLKTAVINYVHTLKQKGAELPINDICASFQVAAIDGLIEKAIKVAKKHKMNKIVLAGGVAANSYLRARIDNRSKEEGLTVYYPPRVMCTDNAAMIGSAGYYNLINEEGMADLSLTPKPSLPL